MAETNPVLQDIKTGSFHPVYLLYGTENYLKKYYKKQLRQALIPPGAEMNLSVFQDKTVDIPALIDQADTLPFFAEHRLILIEDSGLFKKSCDPLADRIGTFPPETVLVFVETETDARGKLYKAVKKDGVLLKLDEPKEEQLKKWAGSMLAKEGRAIQISAMELLLQRCGADMERLSSEIEKLVSYTEGKDAVMKEDVAQICTATPEDRIFEMMDAIGTGSRQQALSLYRDMLALKEPPMRILALMGRHLNQLLQISMLRGEGFDRASIAQKMNLKDYFIRKLLGQAMRFEENRLRQALEDCVSLEEQVKTGRLTDRTAVELLIVSCTQHTAAS